MVQATFSPGLSPQEERQRRKEIATFARAGEIRADTNVPQCFTHCFLADHLAWDPTTAWQQHADTLYRNFKEWGQGNYRTAHIDRETFDRHLRRWLLATALTFVVDDKTDTVGTIYGLRMTSRQRTPVERQSTIDVFANLDTLR